MASYLPKAVTKPLAQGADFLRSTLGGVSWGPAVSVSKAAVVSLFNRIEIGQLVVRDETIGQVAVYGQKMAKESSKTNGVNGINGTRKTTSGAPKVELVVKKDAFWVRLFLFADMGFAEAYMLGDVECEDLTQFFEVCSKFSKIFQFANRAALHHQSDPIGQCHDSHILNCFHDYRTSQKHQYPSEFVVEHTGTLRY